MKARILKIFTNNKYRIRYTYVDTAKWRDDVDAYSHKSILIPMMTIRILNDDGSMEDEIDVFASPEIVLAYTKIDYFKILKELGSNDSYEFSIKISMFLYSLWIDFEMKKGEYPYLNAIVEEPDDRDKLIAPIVEYPQISCVYKEPLKLF